MKVNINGRILVRVKKCKYLGSVITEDFGCEVDINKRIAMAKGAFIKKERFLCSKTDMEMSNMLTKCYVRSILF